MKILYAIQGTGNGHVSRAREIVPLLKDYCETDVFLSGNNSQVLLPFEVKYRSKGFSFYYSKKGGLDYFKSLKNFEGLRIWKEINDFPVEKYDLVINDFECISAYAAKFKKVPCFSFSHQAAYWSDKTPRPKQKSILGENVLKYYAPSDEKIGLHFDCFDTFIRKPVIRREVRNLLPRIRPHISVYLPHYHPDILIPIFKKIPDVEWHIFYPSKGVQISGNVTCMPVTGEGFLQSMCDSTGVLTGAGFETPAEAIFLGKKLMCIPIAGQYEQLCNAAALEKSGIEVVQKIGKDFERKLQQWLNNSAPLKIDYPDDTRNLTEEIIYGKKNVRA